MAEENKLEPEFLWLALKKILRVLKVFRGPVLLKRISDTSFHRSGFFTIRKQKSMSFEHEESERFGFGLNVDDNQHQ
jgi:hypothetical protein